MKKILTTIATASIAVGTTMTIAPSVEAACLGPGNCTVTLDGTDYEIDLLAPAGFFDNRALLVSQPWWGSSSLALSASSQVGVGLGGGLAFFAFDETVVSPNASAIDLVSDQTGIVLGVGDRVALSYAIVTESTQPVPEPLTILGTITFGGFIAGMKKRRNENK